MVTFTSPTDMPSNLAKLGQSSWLEIVPVFIKMSSKPPMPIMQPGPACSRRVNRYPCIKKIYSIETSVKSGFSGVWDGPITKTYEPSYMVPLNTRATAISLREFSLGSVALIVAS